MTSTLMHKRSGLCVSLFLSFALNSFQSNHAKKVHKKYAKFSLTAQGQLISSMTNSLKFIAGSKQFVQNYNTFNTRYNLNLLRHCTYCVEQIIKKINKIINYTY